MHRRTILIILFLSRAFWVFNQDSGDGYRTTFRLLDIRNGLSNNTVYSICQDKTGFIWIGTQYGLNRFDGQKFEWFTTTSGLTSNSIRHILQDSDGKLWLFSHEENLFSSGGLRSVDILDPVTLEVRPARDELPFRLQDVEQYFAADDGQILFYAGKKVWLFKSQKGFREIPIPPGCIPVGIGQHAEIWGANGNQLFRIDSSGNTEAVHSFEPGTLIQQVDLLEENLVRVTTESPHDMGDIYFITLRNYRPEHIRRPALPADLRIGKYLRRSTDKANRRVWIGDARQVLLFDFEGNRKWVLTETPEAPLFKNFHTIFTDRHGICWVGSVNGLVLINLSTSRFSRYLWQNPKEVPANQQIKCRGIHVWNDRLLVNTYKARFMIDLRTNEKTQVANIFEPKGNARFPSFTDTVNNCVWTGGGPQLIRNDIQTGMETAHFSVSSDKINVWSAFRDRGGIIWVGTNKGIYYIRPGVDDTLRSYDRLNGFVELQECTVLDFHQDSRGIIRVAASTGFYEMTPETGILRRLWSQGTGADYLPADIFNHILPGENGVFYLSTNGGLVKYDPGNGSYRQYGRQQGLTSNNIYAAYHDGMGFIWMSSDFGIMRLNEQTGEVRIFLTEQGISQEEFNRISHFRSRDGRIWFGGLNGVTAFDPKDFNRQVPSANIPELVFTRFSHLDADGGFKTLNVSQLNQKKITLSYSERLFNVEFALLDFFDAEKIRYAYQLEELHKDWIELRENVLRVEGLRPGKYTLRIRAANPGSDYPTREISLEIVVRAPFYMTWWFWTLALLLAAALVRERIRSFNRKKTELEHLVAIRTDELRRDKIIIEQQAGDLRRLDEMKSRFFANVSHELRTPLTLLLGPIRRLMQRHAPESEEMAYLSMMDENAGELLRRVEDILDLTRLDAGKLYLDEKPAHFSRILQLAVANFEAMAQSRQIDLHLKLPEKPSEATLIDPEKCKTIVTNLLSNALKFTPAGGQIGLELSVEEQHWLLSVSDTGFGIPPGDIEKIFDRFFQSNVHFKNAPNGSGIGLALCRELTFLMDGSLWAQSPGLLEDKGSTFFLKIPYKTAEAVPEPDISAQTQPVENTGFQQVREMNGEKATILLVEDNTYLQEFIRLELHDFQVITANNGQEALALLEQNSHHLPQLIISDVIMPVMDGFSFLEQLKTKETWQQIPVIMLTARAEPGDKLTALRLGVDDYMIKPFVTDELLARIRNLLDRRIHRLATRDEPFGEEELLPSAAETWLREVEQIVLKELGNSRLNQDFLADSMFLSKRQLQRNIKLYTGLSANHFIREIRLNQARLRLESRAFRTVAEVSYAVGYDDQHYFSTVYFDRFGKKPAAYL